MPNLYENEIEDILGQIDSFDIHSPESKRSITRNKARKNIVHPLWSFFKTRSALKIGILFLIIATGLEISGQNFSRPLALVGAGLLVTSYILFFAKPAPIIEKKWRGQVIEQIDNQSFLAKVRRWLG